MPSPYSSPFPSPTKSFATSSPPKPDIFKLSSKLDAVRLQDEGRARPSTDSTSSIFCDSSSSGGRKEQYSNLSVAPLSPSRSIRRKTIDRDLAKLANAKPVERTRYVCSQASPHH
jgi:hypothetical protein